jgi:hypothetical protein
MANSGVTVLPNGGIMTLLPGGGHVLHNPGAPQNTNAQQAQWSAIPQAGAAQGSPFSSFAPAAADMYKSYSGMMGQGVGTMGQMFDSYAKAFQGYGNTIGNIAGNAGVAAANANADRYAAYSGGLSSYNNMLGALGAGALGAYGSAANAALQGQAMRETAYAKAFADSLASNQSALSQYGVGRDASLAALGNSYANLGGQVGQARGDVATAAANLSGGASTALSNLGVGMANSAANASTGTAQGRAALSAAIANALSGAAVGQQNALASNSAGANTALAGLGNASANSAGALGQANAAFGTGMGNSMAGVAGNAVNYTRDMAKLDLARMLGIGQLNVSSQLGGSFGAPGGSVSLSGPSGLLGQGSYAGGATGISSGQAPITLPQTPGWYSSSPQYYDGGGMGALNSVADRGFGQLSGLASDNRSAIGAGMTNVQSNMGAALNNIMSSSQAARDAITGEAASGGSAIDAANRSAMSEMSQQGNASRAGILDALSRGTASINDQTAGLNADAARGFGGIDANSDSVRSSPVLRALQDGYASGSNQLRSVYESGRSDPASLLQQIYTNTAAMTNPFLSAGKDAYGGWMTNFPSPLTQIPGAIQDPMPYLAALQAGWSPFMSGLDRAMTQQNANVLGILTSGQSNYNNSLGNLTNQYLGSMGAVRDAMGRMMGSPEQKAPRPPDKFVMVGGIPRPNPQYDLWLRNNS